MADKLYKKSQRVRVTNPVPRHQRMCACVGTVVEIGKGGTYRVLFPGGKGLFHESELSPAESPDQPGQVRRAE